MNCSLYLGNPGYNQLKAGLRTADGELREDWARHIARIHQSLLANFEKE